MINIIVLLLSLYSTTCIAEDIDGFRGIKWGTHVSQVSGLLFLPDDSIGEDKCYRRKEENLRVGGAILTRVDYYFYRDRFYLAALRSKRTEDFFILKSYCKNLYGEGVEEEDSLGTKKINWCKGTVDICLFMTIKYVTAICLKYEYRPILQEKKEDIRRKTPDPTR